MFFLTLESSLPKRVPKNVENDPKCDAELFFNGFAKLKSLLEVLEGGDIQREQKVIFRTFMFKSVGVLTNAVYLFTYGDTSVKSNYYLM